MRVGMAMMTGQVFAPDADAVLKSAATDAGRRGHAQTTPLHVAAALLGAPGGSPLRHACLQMQNPTSPLRCRGLQLCFNVALDRLPANPPVPAPTGPAPYSNALIAALKRAQAHQRRGCPEQHLQPQPLLAVKVELEQLVISILDDPSVSRIMREAGFISTEVKAHLEDTLSFLHSSSPSAIPPPPTYHYNLHSNLSLHSFLNPRISLIGSGLINKNIHSVLDIMLRRKKRNPMLMSESISLLDRVIQELMLLTEKQLIPEPLRKAKFLFLQLSSSSILSVAKEDLDARFRKLSLEVESSIPNGGAVVIHIGDLQWLLLQSPTEADIFCPVNHVVYELGRIFARHSDNGGRLWLISTTTLQTYLQLKARNPSIEDQWDFQPLPISTVATHLSNLEVKSAVADKSFMPKPLLLSPSTFNSSEAKLEASNGFYGWRGERGQPSWVDNTKLVRSEPLHSCSSSVETCGGKESDTERASKKVLPSWLQSAITPHRNNSDVPRSILQEKHSLAFEKTFNEGGEKMIDFLASMEERTNKMDHVSSLLSQSGESLYKSDVHNGLSRQRDEGVAIEQLCRRLSEKVGWQKGAISCVADAVIRCRSGMGRQGRFSSRSDTWLLFLGSDRVGKRKMAKALAESVFGCDKRLSIISADCYNNQSRSNKQLCLEVSSSSPRRSKLPLDRFAEAVKLNPFSVVLIENIDSADLKLKASLRSSFECGRIQDSHWRDVSLSNIIIVMTSDTESNKSFSEKSSNSDNIQLREEELTVIMGFGLRVIVGNERSENVLFQTDSNRVAIIQSSFKTKPDDCHSKKRKLIMGQHLSLDLNLTSEDTNCEEIVQLESFRHYADGVAVFQAFDFEEIRTIALSILKKISISANLPIEVDIKVYEQIIAALWWGTCDRQTMEKWAVEISERGLSFVLKTSSPSSCISESVVKILPEYQAADRVNEPNVFCFPQKISVESISTVTEEEAPS